MMHNGKDKGCGRGRNSVQSCCKTEDGGSGVEGCCRFYVEDQRRCKARASLISHLCLFAFFCSLIHSVDVRQPKKLKAAPEALLFALRNSSSGLKKLIPVISRKQSLPGLVFTVTLQTLYVRAEWFAQRSQVTCSPPSCNFPSPLAPTQPQIYEGRGYSPAAVQWLPQ